MKYKVYYKEEKYPEIINGRRELIKLLEWTKAEKIERISKIYTNGIQDDVTEIYEQYMRRW